jgi:hypothetical protein
MVKFGVNDKCYCGSNTKYKKCCLKKEQTLEELEHALFMKGHPPSSEQTQEVMAKLLLEYKGYQVIDVSNILADDTYQKMQLMNFKHKTIMVAQKNNNNASVFDPRVGPIIDADIMVMFQGSFKCFKYCNFGMASHDIKGMIIR